MRFAIFAANLVKIPDGGWYALLVATLCFVVMSTWRAGRRLLAWRLADRSTAQENFLAQIEADPPYRVPGTVARLALIYLTVCLNRYNA